MKNYFTKLSTRPIASLLVFLAITLGMSIDLAAQACAVPNWQIVASGLTNPRSVRLGPDGNLYVAEAGVGGDQAPTCPLDTIFAPYSGGHTARISRIRRDGVRETVADNLPSTRDAFGDALGASDIGWIGDTLYALIEGGGCTRGLPNHPAGIVRINSDGTYTYVADITAFIRANPVANEPDCGPFGDCEPDGVPHKLLVDGDDILVVETNHNSILRVNPATGSVSRIYDLSIQDPAPIVLTRKGGDFFLGGFDGLIQTFSNHFGAVSTFDEHYSAIVDMETRGKEIYVLETFAPETPWTPDTGRVVRRNGDGTRDIIACGLNFPIGMVRRGNDLFVSNSSFGQGPVPGMGQIVRIKIGSDAGH